MGTVNKLKPYDLVIAHDLATLIATVNEAINLGYIPLGGFLYVEGQFIQAILLKEK